MGLSVSQMALMSRLLDEALPLDATARRLWLERLSPEYSDVAPALREALLPGESQAAVSNPLWALPKLVAADAAGGESTSFLQAGARVGPYELIQPLGAGGMAEVWLARRADGALKRTVALKIPTLTRLSGELEQRFARERDILASLEHPHIARLYDAGIATDNKLPYFAMEYVEGQALTDWCDARRLPIAARLELCLQVLDAMQYAHDKHVVHRDLKPSNILVTEGGQVRLLDFGVAKLLEEEADQTQLTSVYGRALTPSYASPELLRGERLDARCDIYSFGVVLYELLTGARPYQLQSAASIGLLEQAIARLEVRKPSTQLDREAAARRATTQEGLARQLRGDLDAVVIKTLAKEPAERYPSAADVAKDLRRYLEGRPITALPARFPYRLRKFVRRNKPLFAVSITAIAAVVIAVGYTIYRETTPRAPGYPSIAVLPLTNESGDASQQYFSDGLSEDLITALSQSPGLKVIGRTSAFHFRDSKEDSRSIGAKLGVAHLLEGSVRRSGEMVRVSAELIDTADGSAEWSERYDRPYKDLFALQDEITRAVAGVLRARLLPAEHPAAQSERPPGGSLEAYNALLQGRFYLSRHKEADYRKAIEFYTQAIQLDARYAFAWSALSTAWTWLGTRYLAGAPRQEAFAKAREAAERALALSPELAAAHLAQVTLLLNAHLDWRGAQVESRRALALAPNDASARFYVASLLAIFGEVEPAIELTRQVLAAEPLRADYYRWLAMLFRGHNRLDEAEWAIRRAIELQPGAEFYHHTLTTIEVTRGNAQAALAAAQQEPNEVWRDSALTLALQITGDRSAADAALRTLIEKHANYFAYQIARVYALRNDAKQTFEWLDRAWGNRDSDIGYLLFDPFILRYRDDPRFAAFCYKVGLWVPREARRNSG
ncbi:MAG TPA: protein kinase [Stellaceae bacterium]|nr:protein kinase [Stellaceae bacterium]